MTTKVKIIICTLVVLTVFAAGRYSAPTKIKTETKIVEVEKKTDDKKSDVKDHKKTTIVETTAPDGTKTKTTTITDDKESKSDDKSTDDTSRTTDQTKEVSKGSSPLSVSLLAGLDISAPGTPIYGLAVSRPILGPVTLGLFGMTNRTGGVSIGLTF